MGMSINTNQGAILVVAAQRASAMMDEAMTRLSTGKRLILQKMIRRVTSCI